MYVAVLYRGLRLTTVVHASGRLGSVSAFKYMGVGTFTSVAKVFMRSSANYLPKAGQFG